MRGARRWDQAQVATLRAQGRSWTEIANQIRQETRISARAAMRRAHGWTQAWAAEEWNRRWPEDRKDRRNIGWWESWPNGGRAPSVLQLARLAALYGCGVDDLLVDVDYSTQELIAASPSPGVPATIKGVDRRGFLGGTAAMGMAAAAMPSVAAALLSEAIAPPPVLARVGRTEIDQVQAAAALFNNGAFAYGGGYALAAAHAQLGTATKLLEADCPETLRDDLFSSVGMLADTCGFMAFDRGDHANARRMFGAAVACTEEAGDVHLQTGVLMNMSVQALWLDCADDALAFTERALAHSHDLTATELAMVWSTRAGAHGRKGDTEATLRAIGAADDHFERSNPATDPSWMDYYTEAEHAGNTGHALFYLAGSMGGGSAEALARHETAIGGHGDGYARSRAFAEARRAIMLMRSGDPDEAAQAGLTAVDSAGPLLSTRTREYLDVLKRAAAPYAGRAAVSELSHRIDQSA